ncbi:MAG TPA: TMEM175 family protein [Trebonia sp.]
MNRGRLEMFSDAVFAVAITLLALNLTIAGPGHGPLTGQLAHQWQAFVAYLISFFTIGVTWVNHHTLLSSVKTVTQPLLFFNLLVLLFVVLIPAATRLLAVYLPVDGFGAHLAAAVYGTVIEGRAIGFFLIREWALREGRTQPPVPPDRRWAARLRYLLGPVLYLVAIGAAFIHPLLTLGLSGAVSVYYVFEQTPLRVKDRDSARPDEPVGARRQRADVLMDQIRDLQDEYAEDVFRLAAENTALKKRARRLADDNRAL